MVEDPERKGSRVVCTFRRVGRQPNGPFGGSVRFASPPARGATVVRGRPVLRVLEIGIPVYKRQQLIGLLYFLAQGQARRPPHPGPPPRKPHRPSHISYYVPSSARAARVHRASARHDSRTTAVSTPPHKSTPHQSPQGPAQLCTGTQVYHTAAQHIPQDLPQEFPQPNAPAGTDTSTGI